MFSWKNDAFMKRSASLVWSHDRAIKDFFLKSFVHDEDSAHRMVAS
jgi:hypothetical protein